MADYLSKRGANVAPSYASVGDLPASTEVGDLVFVDGQLGIAVDASTFKTCDKTDIATHPILGDNYGVLAGGYNVNSGSTTIQRYSHSSDGNSVDTTADLTTAKHGGGSAQTLAKGYALGGQQGGTEIYSIEVYTFANSSTNATTMGVTTPSLSGNTAFNEGSSGYSDTHMYYHGTRTGTYNNGYPTSGNKKNVKTAFTSTSGSMTDVGTLTGFSYGGTGGHSDTHGYADCGNNYSGASSSRPNNVSRYAFASDGNASAYSSVGSSHEIYFSSIADSREKHYMGGGRGAGDAYLSSFSHASGGTATSTNSLVSARGYIASTVSSTHVYFASGSSAFYDNNEKIAFASDTSAASAVGSIVVATASSAQDYSMFQFQH